MSSTNTEREALRDSLVKIELFIEQAILVEEHGPVQTRVALGQMHARCASLLAEMRREDIREQRDSEQTDE